MRTLSAPRRILLARCALAAYSLVIAWITLSPAQDAAQVTGVVTQVAKLIATTGLSSAATAYSVFEFVANIALFAPFGLLVKLSFPRLSWLLIVAIGFGTSLTIELVQLGLPSRFSTVSDLVANTFGTACLLGFVKPVTADKPRSEAIDVATERV